MKKKIHKLETRKSSSGWMMAEWVRVGVEELTLGDIIRVCFSNDVEGVHAHVNDSREFHVVSHPFWSSKTRKTTVLLKPFRRQLVS